MARLRRDLGTAEQFIVDSSFNADEGHMTAVCEALRRRAAGPARRWRTSASPATCSRG